MVPMPCVALAIHHVSKAIAHGQCGGEQHKACAHKAVGQALQGKQRQAAVRVRRLPDAGFGPVHHPRMDHGGAK